VHLKKVCLQKLAATMTLQRDLHVKYQPHEIGRLE